MPSSKVTATIADASSSFSEVTEPRTLGTLGSALPLSYINTPKAVFMKAEIKITYMLEIFMIFP